LKFSDLDNGIFKAQDYFCGRHWGWDFWISAWLVRRNFTFLTFAATRIVFPFNDYCLGFNTMPKFNWSFFPLALLTVLPIIAVKKIYNNKLLRMKYVFL
jgi:hypothetical protein